MRNTDSFFKDENTETRKITLTPNLLRDDSSTSTTGSRERGPSLESLEKNGFADKVKDDKKKKDKKHLSKKARLRQWRQETFGDAEGPKGGFELLVGNEEPAAPVRQHKKRKVEETEGGIIEGEKKKKRRSRKKKSAEDEI